MSRPDLIDPQLLLLELAHGMLVANTQTYIDCPYHYWPIGQLPGRRVWTAMTRQEGRS